MNDTSHTILPEWHNENALRAYPLADDCKAAEILPAWLLADLRVTVDSAYDRVFVSSAYLSDTLVSLAVSGAEGENPPVGLLARTVTRDELEPGRSYPMDSIDGRSCGVVTFGEIPSGADGFKGVFTANEAPLAANAVVRVKSPGVTKIVDPVHGTEASGLIDLSGNSEFRTYLDQSDTAGKTIVIELTDLYRDLTTSVCSASPSADNCGETPVLTINGVPPVTEGDNAGTIYLRFR